MLQSTNSLRNIAELEIHINKTHNICSALLSQLGRLFSPSHRNHHWSRYQVSRVCVTEIMF